MTPSTPEGEEIAAIIRERRTMNSEPPTSAAVRFDVDLHTLPGI